MSEVFIVSRRSRLQSSNFLHGAHIAHQSPSDGKVLRSLKYFHADDPPPSTSRPTPSLINQRSAPGHIPRVFFIRNVLATSYWCVRADIFSHGLVVKDSLTLAITAAISYFWRCINDTRRGILNGRCLLQSCDCKERAQAKTLRWHDLKLTIDPTQYCYYFGRRRAKITLTLLQNWKWHLNEGN